MKICQLIELLNKAHCQTGPDSEVILAFEDGVMEDGFDFNHCESIVDVRLFEDWPLPGNSLVNYEGEKEKKVLLLYQLRQNVDSSIAS